MSELTKQYSTFVDTLLSEPSSNFDSFSSRLQDLNSQFQVERLLTACIGISAEAGEFMEIMKKIIFQGKEWNDENEFHIKRELSDIIFYLQTACLALNVDIDDIINMNIEKLEARYPGGKFDVHYSENRKKGDL